MEEILATLATLIATYLVTAGIKAVGEWFSVDISGNAPKIIAALTALVLTGLQYAAAYIPADYVSLAQQIGLVLVAILGSFGLHREIAKR